MTQHIALGYLRVPGGTSDRRVRLWERRLRTFAESEGFPLVSIFYEFTPGSHAAFDELTRTGARYVVTPSLRHLAENSLLQNSMLARLETTDTEVLTLDDARRTRGILDSFRGGGL
ncbi:hypothetical protein [Amycolatopsis magusensis]|uniref:hypothetical protein n=1 Tax=Amycolatopsis magusensis TaxID=882444 RepID=UPI003C2D9A0F